MQSSGQTYGQCLPDQVERIAASFDVHLELISDVSSAAKRRDHSLTRRISNRAALEREYAAKLQTLHKKAGEKKYKMEAALAVGEHPTKAWDSNTSLISAYTELMDSMTNTAQDHVNLADSLTSQVVEVLRGVEKKNEEAKKTEMQFFQKLLSDRDRIYAERLKCKQKVDETFLSYSELMNDFDPQVRAQDDKHVERAAKQTEQQRNEMLNSKNAYLISIAIANNTKAQFYDVSLPALEDSEISVEPAPKIVLQNKLSRCRSKLDELTPLIDTKHKELDRLSSQFSSYKADHCLGPIDELTEKLLEAQHQFAFYSSSKRVLRSEEETITSAIGVSTTSSTSHAVPSIASDTSAKDSYPTARVLFDFTPTSEFELEVSEVETVRVVEADDGSGWVKVADMQGRDGLVPASYLDHRDPISQSLVTQVGSGQHGKSHPTGRDHLVNITSVRAVYAYEAQGPDELGLIEGQAIELTSGPSGGRNYGSGWWEGRFGIVSTPQAEGEFFQAIMLVL
ncbi:hypothetical protein C0995_013852 [Termitomyces sp. Mi166|nr:hypothetical protein C0995_013852 [Termitomyces sp. Mi166\